MEEFGRSSGHKMREDDPRDPYRVPPEGVDMLQAAYLSRTDPGLTSWMGAWCVGRGVDWFKKCS